MKNYHRRPRVDSYICNGILYSIIRVFLRASKKNTIVPEKDVHLKQHQSMTLIILKHDSKTDSAKRVLEEELQYNDREHDWCMNLKPFFIHQNVLYYAKYENDFRTKKIHL